MSDPRDWLRDLNGDGFIDDVNLRLVVAPPDGVGGRAYWGAVLDLAARIGLETHALAFPLVSTIADDERPVVELRTAAEAEALISDNTEAESVAGATSDRTVSDCLLDLFTADGALEDRDGDLLPGASRVAFDLPESLPVALGAALANLAARLGLESGGVTTPLARDANPTFQVRPGAGTARLSMGDGGWRAGGEPAELAELLDRVAVDWPHFGQPETGGVRRPVQAVGRALAGFEQTPHQPGEIAWELQWSAQWEVDRLRAAFRQQVVPALAPDVPARITVFASEPVEQRRALAAMLARDLADAGIERVEVRVLCAFKAGLSWLREEVLSTLADRDVGRLRISYQPFEALEDGKALDLRIRWAQELFPGNELAAVALGIPLDMVEVVEATESGPTYTAEAFTTEGALLGIWSCGLITRTLPFMASFPDEGTVQVTTGGFVVQRPDDQLIVPVETDLERFWRFYQHEVLPRLIRTIEADGPVEAARQPFFGELLVDVTLSEPNSALGLREENDSAGEALHEDIYFNTLDTLEVLGQRHTGAKTSAPGPVIPIVHVQPGMTPHARVRLRRAAEASADPIPRVRVHELRLTDDELELGLVVDGPLSALAAAHFEQHIAGQSSGSTVPATLTIDGEERRFRVALPKLLGAAETATSAPPMDFNLHGSAVIDALAQLTGFAEVSAWIEEYSFEGRPIPALALRAPTPGRYSSPTKEALLKPTSLIVARHHANEISSTNAALQLAYLCASDPEWRRLLDRLNIIILPYENADGAALHARLAADPAASTWKHHPARYNAVGFEFSEDFFNPATCFGESRARPAVYRRWPADAIVDNHGVPSHEWVQPFAGFGSPPRFRVSYWVPQALIYGIVRYVEDAAYPEHRTAALALRDAVSAAIGATDVRQWNAEIWESYRFWGQAREPERFPGELHDGMLWHISTGPADASGRGFNVRYPCTTALSWVTEVNDETARDAHLERVARAHLIANRAMLDMLAGAAPTGSEVRVTEANGLRTWQVGRERPLRVGSDGG